LSNDSEVNKERLYFAQCNEDFFIRCPFCTKTKKYLGQCKIFKNLQSLWRHLKKEHLDIPESELNEIIHVLNNIFQGFKWHMFPTWAYSEKPKTTSSSFLLGNKKIRNDEHEKLEEIANLLKTQSEHFPKFKPKFLTFLVEEVLGPCDIRTKKKYIENVTRFSKKDMIHGIYDVTEFCKKLAV